MGMTNAGTRRVGRRAAESLMRAWTFMLRHSPSSLAPCHPRAGGRADPALGATGGNLHNQAPGDRDAPGEQSFERVRLGRREAISIMLATWIEGAAKGRHGGPVRAGMWSAVVVGTHPI